MRNKLILALSLAFLCSVIAAQGKEFWHKKDFKQWTEFEVNKLLEDSPWTRRYTLSEVFIDPLQRNDDNVTNRARESKTDLIYQAQLRSALPLRQAMVRRQQLAANYDKMTPGQKQPFDQQSEKFLAAQFPDTVVLTVTWTTNTQQDDRDLSRHWMVQSVETLKINTFLLGPNGLRLPPQQFHAGPAGSRSFQFVFPRLVDGKPLVTPQDKRIQLEFQHPKTTNYREARILLEFKVDKMLMNGAVVY